MLRFVVLFLMTSLVASRSVTFKDCGSVDATISEVTADPCSSEPCNVDKGKNYTIGIKFSTKQPITTLTNKITGIIGGLPLPFPYDHPDACKDCGLNCPLNKDTDYTFTATLPVKSEYPSVSLVAKWELIDQLGTDLACVEIPLVIVSPSTGKKVSSSNYRTWN